VWRSPCAARSGRGDLRSLRGAPTAGGRVRARRVPPRSLRVDVGDAAWLAELGAHGLLRACFVPPPPIRRLRDLTRTRTSLTGERTRAIHRTAKILEDAGITLSSVASNIMGVSGRATGEALIAGDEDPAAIAELAKASLRSKIPALTEALTGRFTAHHGFLVRLQLNLIDQFSAAWPNSTPGSRRRSPPWRLLGSCCAASRGGRTSWPRCSSPRPEAI